MATRILNFALLCVICAQVAFGQNSGTIKGRVLGDDGKPIAGARIHIAENGQQDKRISGKAPLVNFKSATSTPLDVIIATGVQTRAPIGIVFGEHQLTLCNGRRDFDITGATPGIALAEAIRDTGYSLKTQNSVNVLVAPDMLAWQQQLLDYRYVTFPADKNVTMNALGFSPCGSTKSAVTVH
jgi:hypothetical protein